MEIERKFLVDKTAMPDLSQFEYHDIEQFYVLTEPVIRARRKDDKYILTVKGSGMMARSEFELPLSADSYAKLMTKSEGVIITKRRYLIPYNGYTIELDVFSEPIAPLIMAEIEFDSIDDANAFIAPTWFTDDVTNDSRYHNSNMSKGNYPR